MIELAFDKLFRSKLSHWTYSSGQYDTNSNTEFESGIKIGQNRSKMIQNPIDFDIFNLLIDIFDL